MRVEQTEVYRDWISALKDRAARARILVRVDRLVHGNPGSHRHLTDGVSELKIDVGPGYRVYYTRSAVTGCCCSWWVATSPRRPKIFNAPSSWRKALRSDEHGQGCSQRVPNGTTKTKTKTKTVPYDVAEQLRTPEEMMAATSTPGLMKRPTTGRHRPRTGRHCPRQGHVPGRQRRRPQPREPLPRLERRRQPQLRHRPKVARALGVKLHAAAA